MKIIGINPSTAVERKVDWKKYVGNGAYTSRVWQQAQDHSSGKTSSSKKLSITTDLSYQRKLTFTIELSKDNLKNSQEEMQYLTG